MAGALAQVASSSDRAANIMLSNLQYVSAATMNIDPKEVERLQGHRKGPLPGKIQGLIQSEIAHGCELVQPQAVFSVSPCLLTPNGTVRIEGGTEFSIGAARSWAGIKKWAIAVCTIGGALEREVTGLFSSGEYARAAILDGVGSVAVESVADYVNNLICREALAGGLEPAPRISPGYGRWPLEEQGLIFELLPARRAGVSLTERYMMQPRKSISFGIGIGLGMAVADTSRCRRCRMTNCAYRAA